MALAKVSVDTEGGIFEDTRPMVDRTLIRALDAVGEAGVKMVRQRLDKVLKRPTGRYRARVDFTVRSDTLAELHDSGVIYGPWLEVGRRGTRFKGYSTFRKVAQDLEGDADTLATPAVDQLAKELS